MKNTHGFPINLKRFNPFGDLLGLSFEKCEKGISRCFLVVNEDLLNPHEVTHGGVLFTLADTGMGGALYTELGEGESCSTIEIRISYFRAVASGLLTCESKIVNRGKSIATLESEIKNEGRLVAKATGTFFIKTQET